MSWRDWLLGRKPKGPVNLVPPRFVGDAAAKQLVISVALWGKDLKNDYGLTATSREKVKGEWKKLWDVGIVSRNIEIVSLLRPDERAIRARTAFARLPDFSQCVPQRIAEALTWELLGLVWPLFSGRSEVRLHCFGTVWEDEGGGIWVPRVRLVQNGCDFLASWMEDDCKPTQNVWTENDFALIFN